MHFRGLLDCSEAFTKAYQVAVLHYEGAENSKPNSQISYERRVPLNVTVKISILCEEFLINIFRTFFFEPKTIFYFHKKYSNFLSFYSTSKWQFPNVKNVKLNFFRYLENLIFFIQNNIHKNFSQLGQFYHYFIVIIVYFIICYYIIIYFIIACFTML